MKETPRISDAEWEIMKVLWSKSPSTTNDVMNILGDRTGWKPGTIKSLMNRLLKKNAIAFNQEGKTYLYFPLVTEEEFLKTENQSFLERLYGGSLKPMFVNFLKHQKLSQDDVEELKKILDERKFDNE